MKIYFLFKEKRDDAKLTLFLQNYFGQNNYSSKLLPFFEIRRCNP